ncbi:site-2 protease family protein [Priestia aryabhattai]|uniref:site-2 protease family protein n=1 Tax=Priestia TaxID=2800373 RepID=UPI0008DDC680|nr:site-2 protease family protein [Priestia aryabhattai]MBZ6484619.1 site-2 protease family protein [Priestia aryabhattai]MDH3111889.1 site-2 protease family protein [Priestia aryabhattai]MDH3129196.1 site-2 protease family protein [Priestia aryabhattai]MDH3130602.1 site-2 protease family protein [Priestia aryabhattai]MED4155495.1 site-2 protease family protein [Priestia aryabhattai]
MEHFLAFSLQDLPYVVMTLIVAFTLHEFAHAYVAYLFGDHTAKKQGRLTLSPLAHLDPFGTLLLIIAGFGWAKPVPVNRYFFKKPRLAGILVSIAGPFSNLLLAFIGLLIYYLMNNAAVDNDALYRFFTLFIQINLTLGVFNLLPFPPLDGYRVIEDLVPSSTRAKMTQYESWGIFVFLILVITPLDRIVIWPLLNGAATFVMNIFQQILALLIY